MGIGAIGADLQRKTLKTKIKIMISFNNNSIFPALPALSLAGKAQTVNPSRHRRPTLSRRELRRLIADMVD